MDVFIDFGSDAGALPVALEADKFEPLHAVVLEGEGGEDEGAGVRIAAEGGGGGEFFFDVDFGLGVVAVAGLGSGDAGEGDAFLGEGGFHFVRGLFLAILVAVVGDGGGVGQVGGVFGGIVHAPELLFPGEGGVRLGKVEVEEVFGFGEAGTGGDGDPIACEVGTDVPGGSAAHGEAADEDAIFIDGVMAFDGGEGFVEVGFAGEAAGIAEAAVEVEDDGVGRREFAGAGFAFGEEVDFAEGFIAAVEPGIEAPAVGGVGAVAGGDDEAVGLDAVVDAGAVAANDEAGGVGPGGFAFGELGCSFEAVAEEGVGFADFVGLEEFVVAEGVADGFAVDEDVGQ